MLYMYRVMYTLIDLEFIMEPDTKTRKLDDDELEKEIPVIVRLLRDGPYDVLWKVLRQFDIITLYRMCRANKMLYNLCNAYDDGQGVWKTWFLSHLPDTVVDNIVQNLSPIINAPTLFGQDPKPINWLWLSLAHGLAFTYIRLYKRASLNQKTQHTFVLPKRTTPPPMARDPDGNMRPSILLEDYFVVASFRKFRPALTTLDVCEFTVSYNKNNLATNVIDTYIKYPIFRYMDHPTMSLPTYNNTNNGFQFTWGSIGRGSTFLRIFYAWFEAGLAYHATYDDKPFIIRHQLTNNVLCHVGQHEAKGECNTCHVPLCGARACLKQHVRTCQSVE